MAINDEDIRIQIKLEQDFPFNSISIKEDILTDERGIFFNGMFTGFTYSPTDGDTLKESGQERYAEIIFYESLRRNLHNYLVTNKT